MAFPQELKEMRRWVNYRLVPDPSGDKPKKMPMSPVTGQAAKSNDPSTWTDYTAVCAAVERFGFTGIGFMFLKEDGLVGVDIDHCYDPETKVFNDVATAILAKQPTYAEFSPSGDGVHLWFRGKKPAGASKNTETGVEMYDSVRYFTVTENTLPGAPETVAEALPDTLKWIHDTYIAKKKEKKKKAKSSRSGGKLTDEEILDKASASAGGENFAALWAGNWAPEYPSQSEADLALCTKLAFWSGKDRDQMDRMFRQSGLFRTKWDEKHHADGSTYGEETLDKAIEGTDEVYSPKGKAAIFEYEGQYFRSKGDAVYPITNFIVRPIEMIVADEETQLTADFVNTRGETYRMTFMTTDFGNTARFKTLLNTKTISLAYFGGDGDLELFKSYVSEMEWVTKVGVKAVGIYEQNMRGVFVSTEGAVDANDSLVEDIVQLEKYRSIDTRILKASPLRKEQLQMLGNLLMTYNEPAKTVSILAWIAACFLKEHMRSVGIKFPHLMLIGEAGSGKSTTLERVVMPMFSRTKVIAAGQITAFTLMKEAASSNTVPLALDEFKPSKLSRYTLDALYNHLRDSYDGHAGIRGRADQTTVSYELLAPLVVAGEESADETAIRERSIELLFSKRDLKSAEHRVSFQQLAAAADILASFGRRLLSVALRTTPAEASAWHSEGLGCFSKELPTRVVSNLACLYAGLHLLEKLCAEMEHTWLEVFPYNREACCKYAEYAAREYLLDGGTYNKSVVEHTLEIMSRMQLDPRTDYTILDGGKVLALRLNHIYDAYTKYRKDYAIVAETLTYAQFKKQLQHSDFFIESNVQKRIGTENRRVWTLNYELLKVRCDVSGFEITEVEPL